MLYPWPYFPYHWEKQWEFNEPIQFVLVTSGVLITTLLWCWKLRTPSRMGYLAILWTGAFLTMVTAGIHPTKGYWAYTIGLAYPAIVESIVWLIQQLGISFTESLEVDRRNWRVRFSRILVAMGLLVLMIPGSGIRTTLGYWLHWGEKEYHAPRFIEDVLAKLPKDGLFHGRCQLRTRCLR